jgi:hypothetical protein
VIYQSPPNNGCRRRRGALSASLWPLGPARLTQVVAHLHHGRRSFERARRALCRNFIRIRMKQRRLAFALAGLALIVVLGSLAARERARCTAVRYEGLTLEQWMRRVEGASSSEERDRRLEDASLAFIMMGVGAATPSLVQYLKGGSRAERWVYQRMPYVVRFRLWRHRHWSLYGRKEATLELLHHLFDDSYRTGTGFNTVLKTALNPLQPDLLHIAADCTELPHIRSTALALLARVFDNPGAEAAAVIERLKQDPNWQVSFAAQCWAEQARVVAANSRLRAAEAQIANPRSSNSLSFEPLLAPDATSLISRHN